MRGDRVRQFVVVTASLLVGCGRNELVGDLEFPEVEDVSVDAPTSMGAWSSFDVSPDETRMTISFYDVDQSALGYAVGIPDPDGNVAWTHERVDGYPESNGLDTGKRGKYSSQRTAPDGTVWIAYWDELSKLRVAHRLGPANWELTDVDIGGGRWASLALSSDGLPIVVHADAAGHLKRSAFDGTAWATKTLFTSVDAANPAGVSTTDLLIDEGREYVAFTDTATGVLHLMIDGNDSVVAQNGAWPSMLMDGSKLRMAWQDTAGEDLRVGERGDNGWTSAVVDDGQLRGADTDLFVFDGELGVLYFDGFDNDQRWARREGGATWSHAALAGTGTVAGFHNEAIQVGGFWYAASYDYTADALLLQRL